MRTYEPGDISEHQTEHATSLRVPFLTSPYPHWYYITGIVVDGKQDGTGLWGGVIPTDDEVSEVARGFGITTPTGTGDRMRSRWPNSHRTTSTAARTWATC